MWLRHLDKAFVIGRDHFALNAFFCHNFFKLSPFQGLKILTVVTRLGCPSTSVCCLEISLLLSFPIMPQMENLESCSPLVWVVVWSRHIDEAFVEGEVVSDCVVSGLARSLCSRGNYAECSRRYCSM